MNRNQRRMASQHSFAMVPRSDIPRSRYMLQQARKATFDGGDLVPIYCEEMLPGDHFSGTASLFARLATPITPVLDNAELETFFFFVPNRIVWNQWENFIAGVDDFTVPQVISPAGGFANLSIYDLFGIPPAAGIVAGNTISVNALPYRGYNLIYNEWFRDQNLVGPLPYNYDSEGPDDPANYSIQKRAKKHDYFTSALPWPQKGTAVSIPLGTYAPVIGDQVLGNLGEPTFEASGLSGTSKLAMYNGTGPVQWSPFPTDTGPAHWEDTALVADLSTATAATINALRLAFQVQRMLEKDARGGSRYTEQIQQHFGVRPPDYRLQRPEYIGGGRTMVNTHPIAQTSETAETPLGNLAAFTTASGGGHNFQYAATEHGYIIGLANVRCDITYQQGTRRHWGRQTRYDYYFPTLAHLGEQAILRKEIYTNGQDNNDNAVFGYQERFAEYRYTPNEIVGMFRSQNPTTIDIWHYSEEFGSAPQLNSTFILDKSEDVLGRSMAVGAEASGQQILLDMLFRVKATRPMPTYSVPGLIDHF